jgi:hypothetical protein
MAVDHGHQLIPAAKAFAVLVRVVCRDQADSYGDYKLKEVAISLAGVRTTAKMCVERGYKLCADEKEYLLAMIAADEMTPSIDNTED